MQKTINTIKYLYNGFVTSSENANQWSLRVKGVLTFALGKLIPLLAVWGVVIPEPNTVIIATQVASIGGAIMFVYGFVRWVFNSYVEPKAGTIE